MSEHLHSAEHHPRPELTPDANKEKDLLKEKLEAAKNSEHLDVSEARSAVDKLAPISTESQPLEGSETGSPADNVSWWSKELSVQNFDRTLASVRRKLSPPERQFSKLVHKPAVEKTSDVLGKTIARPSGILFGGIFSFVLSLGAYLLARHLGGELHYSIFSLTFVGGYVFGLFVELVWRFIRVRKHSA